jgi:hypothetical protein
MKLTGLFSPSTENKNNNLDRRKLLAGAMISAGVVGSLLSGCGIEVQGKAVPTTAETPSVMPKHIHAPEKKDSLPETVRLAGESLSAFDCTVNSMLDRHQAPDAEFQDGQPRALVEFSIAMKPKSETAQINEDMFAAGGVIHRGNRQLRSDELRNGLSDTVDGTFRNYGYPAAILDSQADGSTIMHTQFFPKDDIDSVDQQVDLFVFQSMDIADGDQYWNVTAAIPCGTVKKQQAGWSAVKPLPSDVSASYEAMKY